MMGTVDPIFPPVGTSKVHAASEVQRNTERHGGTRSDFCSSAGILPLRVTKEL